MPSKPFQRGRFDLLPERPIRPHPFWETEGIDVEVPYPGVGPIRTHVRRYGEGPPLFLVHGLMTSSYSWRYVLEPLGAKHTLYALDLPGNGRTERPTQASYAPDRVATYLGEVMRVLGIRGAPVIGNSMGGYLSMRLALQDGGAMSRLVNLHSPGLPTPRMFALAAALSAPGAHSLLGWLVRRAPLRWTHANVHYYDEDLKSLEEAREYAAPLTTPEGRVVFGKHLGETLAVSAMRRFEAELAERARRKVAFPVPLMLVYADRDPMVPPSVGARMSRLLPDAEMVWMKEASHFAHVDAAERFAEIALRFLAS